MLLILQRWIKGGGAVVKRLTTKSDFFYLPFIGLKKTEAKTKAYILNPKSCKIKLFVKK